MGGDTFGPPLGWSQWEKTSPTLTTNRPTACHGDKFIRYRGLDTCVTRAIDFVRTISFVKNQ